MWLHVPNLPDSAPSPSAPASVASTSDWPPGVALCATSSGKPSPRLASWLGWKKRSWIALLSGTISQPSTAERGAAEWISSLEAIPVSPSALQALAKELTIPATSSPTSDASSKKSSRRSSSSKMSPATCLLASRSSWPTWREWAIAWRRACSALRTSVRLTAASASGSWPTARASDGHKGPGESLRREGWPTPTSGDAKASGASGYATTSGRHTGTTLTDAAVGARGTWATPNANERTFEPRQGDHGAQLANEACGHPGQPISKHGAGSLHNARTLGPRFVSILMGFPWEWTETRQVGRKRRYCDRRCMALGQMRSEHTLTRSGLLVRARQHLKSACERCSSTEKLSAHHIDRNWRNNSPEDLMTLCTSCHTTLHHEVGEIVVRRRSRLCPNCGCEFCPKDSRNETCSRSCGRILLNRRRSSIVRTDSAPSGTPSSPPAQPQPSASS